ncbi:PRC-barrel domain-containing protein [Paenibacillus polymyxa]|uniref:PRC-barrel domain-containing protein n=1 Tax=Paenibacillus polymyxa TaxID=1406 RepID=UPI00201A1E58|nr:PRC-barrel domain-containing protein [Paenibacillus polymyxa]MDU8672506.1 PRC-barrel domain-containing protein [Paenibacillus polymyxa]MDU8697413.1 PRC-barrel domain-containing protein [Paenibacillus polymyxa]UQQ34187.1 PRC-barrel domain-containing protein [Paenibacillus polymyxa]URJ56577.1 PRC-barrel domain-containing protein [Paenibacillus polymyxa]URJ64006.1 PRC-barrel domain-containing protein [Paenibacillus polymyxa]
MRLQDMIGLAVFDVEDGKQIGKIHDFMLTADWRITGIELEGKGLFLSHVKMVAWDDIVAYGEDAIMIRNQQAVRKKEAHDIQHTYLLGPGKLKDLSVLTEEGLMLGHISDVYFDQEMGNNIIGLEISDGFVSDIIEGRKWLPCTEDMSIGENAVMVPPLSEQRLEKAIYSVNG